MVSVPVCNRQAARVGQAVALADEGTVVLIVPREPGEAAEWQVRATAPLVAAGR